MRRTHRDLSLPHLLGLASVIPRTQKNYLHFLAQWRTSLLAYRHAAPLGRGTTRDFDQLLYDFMTAPMKQVMSNTLISYEMHSLIHSLAGQPRGWAAEDEPTVGGRF